MIDKALQKYGWQPNWFYEVQHFPTLPGLVEAGLAVVALPQLVFPNAAHPPLVSRKLVKPQIKRTIRVIKKRSPSLFRVGDTLFEIIRNIEQQAIQPVTPQRRAKPARHPDYCAIRNNCGKNCS